MASIQLILIVISILLISYVPESASILSWLTGSGTTTERILGNDYGIGQAPIQYPEESGECSHWGNAGLPHSSYDSASEIFEYNKGLASPGELIGSHRHAPVGSVVAVTNMRTGNTVRVRVVSPKTIAVVGRIMDLSPSAFSQLASLREGVFVCSVTVIQTPRTETISLASHTFDNVLKARPPLLVTRGVGEFSTKLNTGSTSPSNAYAGNRYKKRGHYGSSVTAYNPEESD